MIPEVWSGASRLESLQGTILGPLLFLIFIYSLLLNLPNGSIIAYTDDTVILSSGKSWLQVEVDMKNKLNNVYTWLSITGLSLNINMTVYLTFGCYTDSVPTLSTVTVGGHKLNKVDKTKYLDVLIDDQLTWKPHIRSMSDPSMPCPSNLRLLHQIVRLSNQSWKDGWRVKNFDFIN